MGSSSSASREIGRGRKAAKQSLTGPIQGLQMAPEFFRLLQSPELAGTPLAQSLAAQQAVLQNVTGALTGDRTFAGQLPGDLASAIGENLAGAQGARGTFGSPAGAIEAGLRFSGASEQIRAQRIQSALQAIQGVGAGAIFPSASEFLQGGLQRAQMLVGLAGTAAGIAQQEQAARGQVIGRLVGGVLGLATGGLGGALVGSGLTNSLIGGSGSTNSLNSPYAGLFG